MRKKIISLGLIMCLGLSCICGCSSSSTKQEERTEGRVVNIYCWDTSFKDLYETYASDLAEKHNVKVNFIVITNDNQAYQTNLDEALAETETAIDDDKVDIFLIEADYASKYVKSEYALDVVADVGLTEEQMAGMYQYTKDIVTVDGSCKAVSMQATPGLFAYRRSIAKQVLGTDEPDKVQEMVKDWESFDKLAKKMSEAGYQMLSGYDDSFRTFSNNMTQPWVTDNKINLDESLKKWITQCKEYADKNYSNKSTLWSPRWSEDQGPEGKVFGFFYSTWGINFTLKGNALADASKPEEVGNGNYGDYAVCEGPQAYYWGGTWICAAKGSDNIPFTKDLMERFTCDKETMKRITLETQDFTNNMEAMEEIANSDYKSDFLGGQNHVALFVEAAKKIDMSKISDYDSGLNESLQKAMHEYFDGNVTYEEALEHFYKLALEKYPNLTR